MPLDAVAPEVEAAEEELRPVELEVCREEVVPEVDGAARERRRRRPGAADKRFEAARGVVRSRHVREERQRLRVLRKGGAGGVGGEERLVRAPERGADGGAEAVGALAPVGREVDVSERGRGLFA